MSRAESIEMLLVALVVLAVALVAQGMVRS
jgi:hypothetical protein